jgi:hypothetical protein
MRGELERAWHRRFAANLKGTPEKLDFRQRAASLKGFRLGDAR